MDYREKAREKRGKRISLPFDYTQGKLPAHLGHKLRVNSEAYVGFNMSNVEGKDYKEQWQSVENQRGEASSLRQAQGRLGDDG